MSGITAGNIHRRLWLLHDHGFPTLAQFEAAIALIMAEMDEIDTSHFSFLYPMVYSSIHFTEQEKVAFFRRLHQLDIPCSNSGDDKSRYGYTYEMRKPGIGRFTGLWIKFNTAMIEALLAAGYLPSVYELPLDVMPLEQFAWAYERMTHTTQQWRSMVLIRVITRPDYVAYLMEYAMWDFSNYYCFLLTKAVIECGEFLAKYANRVKLFRDVNHICNVIGAQEDRYSIDLISVALDHLPPDWIKRTHYKAHARYKRFLRASSLCIIKSNSATLKKLLTVYFGKGKSNSYRIMLLEWIIKCISHEHKLDAWPTVLEVVTNPYLVEGILANTRVNKAARKVMHRDFEIRFGRPPALQAPWEPHEVPKIHMFKAEEYQPPPPI